MSSKFCAKTPHWGSICLVIGDIATLIITAKVSLALVTRTACPPAVHTWHWVAHDVCSSLPDPAAVQDQVAAVPRMPSNRRPLDQACGYMTYLCVYASARQTHAIQDADGVCLPIKKALQKSNNPARRQYDMAVNAPKSYRVWPIVWSASMNVVSWRYISFQPFLALPPLHLSRFHHHLHVAIEREPPQGLRRRSSAQSHPASHDRAKMHAVDHWLRLQPSKHSLTNC